MKMKKAIKNKMLQTSAMVVVFGMTGLDSAFAQGAGGTGTGGEGFTAISGNITESIEGLPGLLTGVSYLLGILLGVLGILKIKDHVENPSNTPLQQGAIRLVAGGGLFALPIVYEAMTDTIGTGGTAQQASLDAVGSGLN